MRRKYLGLLALLICICIVIILLVYVMNNHFPSKDWSVTNKGDIIEIAYGSGTDFPQYVALYLKSGNESGGYFRMNYGPESGWGTSIILLPSFWERGNYCQGAPISWTSLRTEGSNLLLSFVGRISNLNVSGNIRFTPPKRNLFSVTISISVDGDIELDNRPGQAFKPVMLSSMRISANEWDAQLAYVGSQSFEIPEESWIIPPLTIEGRVFGLKGGTSDWKTNASTIEVTLDNAMQITGWVTRSSNPNDDNVGFWAASDQIIRSWQYTVTAKP